MRVADSAVIVVDGDDHLPTMRVEDLLQARSAIVLAPHPDDESLACGGLLAAAFQPSGPGAHVVCLTDGGASHPASLSVGQGQLANLRRKELDVAVRQLGGQKTDVTWIGAPDGALAATDNIVNAVIGAAQAAASGLLLAPSPLDPHCDHVAGAEIGRRVAQSVPGLRLGFYPVWSRWHGGGVAPVPSGARAIRLQTGRFKAQKAAAIAAHRSQQGMVINDDPQGFEMPPGFAAFFGDRDEVYFLSAVGDAP